MQDFGIHVGIGRDVVVAVLDLVGDSGDDLGFHQVVQPLHRSLAMGRVRGYQPGVEGQTRAFSRNGEGQIDVLAHGAGTRLSHRVVARPGHGDAEVTVDESVHVFLGVEGADVGTHREEQLLRFEVVLGTGGVRVDVQVVESQLQHILVRIEE